MSRSDRLLTDLLNHGAQVSRMDAVQGCVTCGVVGRLNTVRLRWRKQIVTRTGPHQIGRFGVEHPSEHLLCPACSAALLAERRRWAPVLWVARATMFAGLCCFVGGMAVTCRSRLTAGSLETSLGWVAAGAALVLVAGLSDRARRRRSVPAPLSHLTRSGWECCDVLPGHATPDLTPTAVLG